MNTWQERISRVGFLTSLSSYALFWLADALRPGFVARYLSVHVFLLAAALFGAWWAASVRSYADWALAQYAIALVAGVACAVVVWNVGEGFGPYRLLAVACAALVPAAVVAVIRAE